MWYTIKWIFSTLKLTSIIWKKLLIWAESILADVNGWIWSKCNSLGWALEHEMSSSSFMKQPGIEAVRTWLKETTVFWKFIIYIWLVCKRKVGYHLWGSSKILYLIYWSSCNFLICSMRDELQHFLSQYNTFNSLQPLRVNLTDMDSTLEVSSS